MAQPQPCLAVVDQLRCPSCRDCGDESERECAADGVRGAAVPERRGVGDAEAKSNDIDVGRERERAEGRHRSGQRPGSLACSELVTPAPAPKSPGGQTDCDVTEARHRVLLYRDHWR